MSETGGFDLLQGEYSVLQAQLDSASRASAIANTGGRNARSQHRLRSHGVGNSPAVVRIDFAITFVAEPMLTTGVRLLSNSLDMHALPLATVGVYQWIKDGRGLCIGAHVWVAVGFALDASDYVGLNDVTRGYQLEHHLTFEGAAIRDVSYEQITMNP